MSKVMNIKIDNIVAPEEAPLSTDTNLLEMEESIIKHGIFNALATTKPDMNGNIKLIDGRRRLNACKSIREKQPQIFMELFPDETLPCLFTNFQNEDDLNACDDNTK